MLKRAAVAMVLPLLFGCAPAPCELICGRVVDADGQAVEGARVWADADTLGVPIATAVAVALTDAAGRFTLDAPELDLPLTRTRFQVTAYRDGLALGGCTAHGFGDDVTITLRRQEPFVGRVLNERREPMAGVSVALAWYAPLPDLPAPRFPVGEGVREPFTARTDERGVFTLPMVPPDACPALLLTAEGYGSRLAAAPPNPGFLRLTPAGRVVVEVTGAPDPTALVGLEMEMLGWGVDRVAARSARGEETVGWVFDDVAPGHYRLNLSALPSGSVRLPDRLSVDVRSGQISRIEIEPAETVPVVGRVIDRNTGNGIAGATVVLRRTDGRHGVFAETDADGRFATRCVPGSHLILLETESRYAETVFNLGAEISTEAEQVRLPDIECERLHVQRFLVMAPDGTPAEGAEVRVQVPPDVPIPAVNVFPRWQLLWSDGNGTCSLAGIPSGHSYIACATKGESGSSIVEFVAGETPDPVRLELRESTLCTLTVRVTDQDGNPLPGVQVTSGPNVLNPSSLSPVSNILPSANIIPTGADGVATFPGMLSDRAYTLSLVPGWPSSDPSPISTPEWHAVAGQTHDFGTLVVERGRSEVSGVAIDEHGNPAWGVELYTNGDGRHDARALTDAEGRFRLTGLDPGHVYVLAEVDGYEFCALRADAGGREVSLRLVPMDAPTFGAPPPPRAPGMRATERRTLARKLLMEAAGITTDANAETRREVLTHLAELDLDAAYAAAGDGDTAPVDTVAAAERIAQDPNGTIRWLEVTLAGQDVVGALLGVAERVVQEHPQAAVACIDRALALPATSDSSQRTSQRIRAVELMEQVDPYRAAELWRQLPQYLQNKRMPSVSSEDEARIAAGLSGHDVDAALAYVSTAKWQFEAARYKAAIIRRIAPTQPERAFAILEMIPRSRRIQLLAAAPPRFPPAYIERAAQVARDIYIPGPSTRLLCALASTAPDALRATLLAEALETMTPGYLGSGPAAGNPDELDAIAMVAAAMRRLGYQQHRQLALRTLEHRRAIRHRTRDGNPAGELNLARALAFTCPDVAGRIIRSVLRDAGGVESLPPNAYPALAAAAAEIDISGAVELVERMPDDIDAGADRPKARAILAVVDTCLTTPEQREVRMLTEQGWLPVDG